LPKVGESGWLRYRIALFGKTFAFQPICIVGAEFFVNIIKRLSGQNDKRALFAVFKLAYPERPCRLYSAISIFIKSASRVFDLSFAASFCALLSTRDSVLARIILECLYIFALRLDSCKLILVLAIGGIINKK